MSYADIKRYDLSLGNWGPYNKDYLGLSHISNPDTGAVFCVELFPGLYRRSILISPTVCDSGAYIWGANANLDCFCYRYELIPKDMLYCDALFNITEDKYAFIECSFVNNTERPQNASLNLCFGMKFPQKRIAQPSQGSHSVIDAVDYDKISCNMIMASDGKYLAEAEFPIATGKGTAIDGKYFFSAGHFVKYTLPNCRTSKLGIRYICKNGGEVKVKINDCEYLISAEKSTKFSYSVLSFPLCDINSLEISPLNTELTLDCIVVGSDADLCSFSENINVFNPQTYIEKKNKLILKYHASEYLYTVEFDEPLMIRRLHTNDCGHLLQNKLHDHVSTELFDSCNKNGLYENIFAKPIYLAPHSRQTVKFKIAAQKGVNRKTYARHQNFSKPYSVKCNPDGKAYEFSQNIMAYTTLLNVVYPIYTRRQFIKHNTPGRNWDSLYSWDSGFIGMGLATIDFSRAFDCLNTYLTPPGDIHSPYIFHGSVVPTQIFLYSELINKYPNEHEKLKSLYHSVLQYYKFYSQIGSGKEQTNSGLLKTWHIFYNSGGWDDYPPQKALLDNSNKRKSPNYSNTTPVITTAALIIISKIMKNISHIFGITENDNLFDTSAKKCEHALQSICWDEESGYYSYIVHNENGLPEKIFRHKSGENYNRGFDGIYPYIAGISNLHQSKKILDNIKFGLLTPFGVGTVDTRAAYYNPNGYWNGSIWMPHQWILWKALLDFGECTLATKIAATALKVWENEVSDSYCCFENFMSVSGRGSGFHQFSGLSTPVLMFFEALYTPETITAGLYSRIIDKHFNLSADSKAHIPLMEINAYMYSERSVLILCLESNANYTFFANGVECISEKITDGAYYLYPKKSGLVNVSVYKKTV